MSTRKKIIITLCSLLGVAAIVVGLFVVLRMNRDPAKVYAVSDIADYGGYWNNETLSGTVSTDRLQTVYLSETQEVTAILVQEGDEVSKGDALLEFDTQLTELQLQKKGLSIQKQEQQMEQLLKEYKKLFGSSYQATAEIKSGDAVLTLLGNGPTLTLLTNDPTPGEEEPDDPTDPTDPTDPSDPTDPTDPTDPSDPTDPTEPIDPTDPTDPTEPTEPIDPTEPTEPTEPTDPTEPTEPPVPDDPNVVETTELRGGTGTQEDPYLYLVADGIPLEDSFVRSLLEGREPDEPVWVIFASSEENLVEGKVLSAWGLCFTGTEDGWSFTFSDAADYLGAPLAPLPIEPDEPEPIDPVIPPTPNGGGYTKEELRRMKLEKEQAIRELDLQIKMAKVEYAEMERELGDGVIYADYDGVVLSVQDPEYAYQNGEPVIKVSGGGAYVIRTTINENDLGKYSVGQTMSVMNYWDGGSYEATVESISTYPSTDNMNWSADPNVSFYPMTLVLGAEANLQDGYWVEITPEVAVSNPDAFYLMKAFILQENGKSYAYVRGADGKLEKREIVTGRELWGSEIEILSGLTTEDFVAFPYGKTVADGAKTEEASVEELWGVYY